ncbi:DNA-(apurinic or apyrimidinic site) endonuclease 2-like [Ciona intestinalis]
MMKILTWNINGIRSSKSSMKSILDALDADVVCFQETKITKDQLDPDIALVDGYNSYFTFAQNKSGYSGVATYCREQCTPVAAQAGLTRSHEGGGEGVGCYGNVMSLFPEQRLIELDREGRVVITQHKIRTHHTREQLVTIVNVYCPHADPEKPERKDFKLDFYKILEERARSLVASGSFVIIAGDMNVSHRTIDHCDPDNALTFYDNPARTWMDGFLYNGGGGGIFVDTFRHFHPNQRGAFTCWMTTTRARETNYGTRIDYIFVDRGFVDHLVGCEVMQGVMGSDHCPVVLEVGCEGAGSTKLPPLCSSFIFRGKQQKLSNYFSNKNKNETKEENLKVKNRKITKRNKQSTLSHFVKKPQPTPRVVNPPTMFAITPKVTPPTATVKNPDAALFWKRTLGGAPPTPRCTGHDEPSVVRIVRKQGPNMGRRFFCCARPDGVASNPEARCKYFEWDKKK